MISRIVSRRLDRLEEQTPSGIQHMIKVTYMDVDGSPTADELQERGSVALGRVAKNVAERSARGCPPRMIIRNLSRRLERLEEVITPETVRRVWQIVIVDADGSRREGEKIEWQGPRPVTALRERYR